MENSEPVTLTDEEIKDLQKQVQSWIRSNGMAHIPKLANVLIIENALLLREVNVLRAQLNKPTKPGYKLT